MTKTEHFLTENNIGIESILYSASRREIIVENGLCTLSDVSADDFAAGIAALQHALGRHLDVKIV